MKSHRIFLTAFFLLTIFVQSTNSTLSAINRKLFRSENNLLASAPQQLALSSDDGWIRSYHNRSVDQAYEVEVTPDGNYLVAGFTFNQGQFETTEIWIMKIDPEGNILWQKRHDFDDFRLSGAWQINEMKITSDGSAVLLIGRQCGSCHSIVPNYDEKGWLLKIDNDGNVVWKRSYATEGEDDNHFADFVLVENDEIVVVGGERSSGTHDLWIGKIDGNGSFIWQRSIDTSFINTEGESVNKDERPYAIEADGDDFVIVGSIQTRISSTLEEHSVWAVKINEIGDVIWENSYLHDDESLNSLVQEAEAITVTNDGGYLLAGYGRYDATNSGLLRNHFIKINNLGEIEWLRAMEFTDEEDRSTYMRINTLHETDSGQVMVGGFIRDPQSSNFYPWLMVLDDSGELVWSQAIRTSNSSQHEIQDIVLLENNQYLAVGGIMPSSTNWDFMVIKARIDVIPQLCDDYLLLPLEITTNVVGGTNQVINITRITTTDLLVESEYDLTMLEINGTSELACELKQNDTISPVATISSPLGGDYLIPGPLYTIGISATASDPLNGFGVKHVEFYVEYDGVRHSLGEVTEEPYEITWQMPTNIPSQQINFVVIAEDNAGNRSEEATSLTNYIETSIYPDMKLNWIPSNNRFYLNQLAVSEDGWRKCGATSMAMVLAMQGIIAPEQMTEKTNEMFPNTWNGTGAVIYKMVAELKAQGLINASWIDYYGEPYNDLTKEEKRDAAWEQVIREIDAGNPLIMSPTNGMTPKGHIIVIVGYKEFTENDIVQREIIAYDPYGKWRGGFAGDYQTNEAFDPLTQVDDESEVGMWVFYDFDTVFNYYLITVGTPITAKEDNLSLLGATTPTSPPDFKRPEPINLMVFEGVPILSVELYLPFVVK